MDQREAQCFTDPLAEFSIAGTGVLVREDGTLIQTLALPYPVRRDSKGSFLAPSVWSFSSRGRDYHKMIRERLSAYADTVRTGLQKTGFFLEPARIEVDTEEASERGLALASGLGTIGKNQNLLLADRGSFFYLGVCYWSLPSQPSLAFRSCFPAYEKGTRVPDKDPCAGCQRCIKACPGHALRPLAPEKTEKGKTGTLAGTPAYPGVFYDRKACLSQLSQEKRVLTQEEWEALGDRLFGCDSCQICCPYNKEALDAGKGEAGVEEAAEFFAMTNRELEARHGHRSGRWRGWPILRRNALITLFNSWRRSPRGEKRDRLTEQVREALELARKSSSPLLEGQARAIQEVFERERGERK